MTARLQAWWDDLRASYWFIPAVMTVSAILLSFASTAFDQAIGQDWVNGFGWIYANKPEGARAFLSTIAGSMIGVAGVTFSITIAAVVYATSQFGPRLLTNFMRDTGNQITLGVFIATFIYCLMVLRTVRSAGEPIGTAPAGAELFTGFVPHFSILLAIGFALISVAVLIYFIHHIPDSVHASNVTAGVGKDLRDKIVKLYPEAAAKDAALPREAAQWRRPDAPARIVSGRPGYLQFLSVNSLIQTAAERGAVIELRYRPGDFVMPGRTLALVWPAEAADDEMTDAVRGAFSFGRKRTQGQDAVFLANELVEIAGRALSPGINDPFTAISCMDWLAAALGELARRRVPSQAHLDEDGDLRVLLGAPDFGEFCDVAFGQMRPYVQADRNAALHLMGLLAAAAETTPRREDRETLARHAGMLREGAKESLDEQSAAEVAARYEVAAALLKFPDGFDEAARQHRWLSGQG